MRILHTSDWHLGRIFHGIHLTDDQAHVLEQLIDVIKDTRPDVMLVSGDIFDRSVPPTEAVNLLDEIISRILIDYQLPMIMIAGNHDSPDRLGFGNRLMQDKGLYITGKLNQAFQPVDLYDDYGKVSFHVIPYVEPAIVRDKLENDDIQTHDEAIQILISQVKKMMDKNNRHVLLSHAFVAGGEESESERPLSVGGSGVVNGAHFKDFHYVALGHLHKAQKIGFNHVRYSGSLMKYSFSEVNHKKSVSLIDMEQDGSISIEEIPLTPRRDIRRLEGFMKDILQGPQTEESKHDYLMVTLKDEGAILDPMGKIRKIYPNALHIERPQFLGSGQLINPDKDFKRMNEVDLFSSFYNQVVERTLTTHHKKILNDVMEQFYQSLRGE